MTEETVKPVYKKKVTPKTAAPKIIEVVNVREERVPVFSDINKKNYYRDDGKFPLSKELATKFLKRGYVEIAD